MAVTNEEFLTVTIWESVFPIRSYSKLMRLLLAVIKGNLDMALILSILERSMSPWVRVTAMVASITLASEHSKVNVISFFWRGPTMPCLGVTEKQLSVEFRLNFTPLPVLQGLTSVIVLVYVLPTQQ